MKNRTVSLLINQSEEKSRTVSLWINQSGNVPCQRVGKRDKPAGKKSKRRTVSTFIEKRDKPELEKICYVSDEEIFWLTMMYLLKKFRKSQTKSSRKSKKLHCNRKEFRREGVVGVVLMREERHSAEKRNLLQVAPNCAALKSLLFLVGGLF